LNGNYPSTQQHEERGALAGNQSDARERAYRAYEQAAKSGTPKQTLDQLWADYLAKLNADHGAAQASKKH
jgi:hypothetical protein